MKPRRIGIIGYGHLGKFLVKCVLERSDLELAFVWNRNQDALLGAIDERLICKDLKDFASYDPDIVVEVAHPVISEKYGELFLTKCDYLMGSPTALANAELEKKLREAVGVNGLYVPSGAFWGAQDIAKMATRNTLKGLKVTMKKHPSCFKLESPLREMNDAAKGSTVTLYEGSVRKLCPLAPNNVNTMAAAAIAGANLGFDRVIGCLISDPSLTDWHIVEVEVTGPIVNGNAFSVITKRKNPADPSAVTGTATYGSFLSSLLNAANQGPGVHMC